MICKNIKYNILNKYWFC